MQDEPTGQRISYAPSALLQLFNTALTPSPTKNILLLRGIYQPGRGANYNGLYYDSLKDEMTDALMTLGAAGHGQGVHHAHGAKPVSAYDLQRYHRGLENSMAQLVELVTTQLKTGYDKEVLNLQEKIRTLEELGGKGTQLHRQELAAVQQQLGGTRELAAAYQVQVEKLEARARAGRVQQWVVWAVVAAVAGVVGGWWGGGEGGSDTLRIKM